jgi:hypothetical protein
MQRVVVVEWKLVGGGGGGGWLLAVGSTSGVFADTLGTGGTSLRSGAGDGGRVGIGGTIGICSGAGGESVAGIVAKLLSQSGEGVMMGTVGGAGMREGS